MVAELIRPSLLEFAKKEKPDLDSKGFISKGLRKGSFAG